MSSIYLTWEEQRWDPDVTRPDTRSPFLLLQILSTEIQNSPSDKEQPGGVSALIPESLTYFQQRKAGLDSNYQVIG